MTRSVWRGKRDEHYHNHMFQRPAEPGVWDENGQRGKHRHQFQCFYLTSSQGWILGLSGEEGSLFISVILFTNSTIFRCFGVMMNMIRWNGMMADERGALYFNQHR